MDLLDPSDDRGIPVNITIDEAGIKALVNDKNGPIARELEFIVANDIEWIVKDTLNIMAPFTVNQRGWRVYAENKPQGPPRQRSGRLWSSISHSRPEVDALGLHCDVTGETDGSYDYLGEQLVPRGYIFVEIGGSAFQAGAKTGRSMNREGTHARLR